MSKRRYKNLLPLLIDGEYKQGDIFEKELSPEDERYNVEAGLIEIQPLKYKVVGGSEVWGHKPGDTFERALFLGEERLLIEGGHIEPVDDEPKKKPAKAA